MDVWYIHGRIEHLLFIYMVYLNEKLNEKNILLDSLIRYC